MTPLRRNLCRLRPAQGNSRLPVARLFGCHTRGPPRHLVEPDSRDTQSRFGAAHRRPIGQAPRRRIQRPGFGSAARGFRPHAGHHRLRGPVGPFVAQGTGTILFGCFAMCLITALAGSYKGTVSMPNFAPAVAMLAIGSAVAAKMSSADDEAMFATMIVIVVLTTLTTAICFILIGRLRLANLFRFMPYPIVGGFLAGLAGS